MSADISIATPDRTPFTYVIVHKATGNFYYGARYAKGCHPDDLWTKYFTHSKKIWELIELEGEDAFTFEVRRTFETKEETLRWEDKAIRRMWRHRPRFMNDSYSFGVKRVFCWSEESRRKLSSAHKGKVVSAKTRERLSVAAKAQPRRPLSEETKNKISASNTGKVRSVEAREKMSERLRTRGPDSNLTKEKRTNAMKRRMAIAENNPMFGKVWIVNIQTGNRQRHNGSMEVPFGWQLGLRPPGKKFICIHEIASGKSVIHDPSVPIPDGWDVGKGQGANRHTAGKVWIHKIDTGKRAMHDPTIPIPDGWIKGR